MIKYMTTKIEIFVKKNYTLFKEKNYKDKFNFEENKKENIQKT